MQYRPLTRGGPQVSVLGFGLWPLAGQMGQVDHTEVFATLDMALERGVNLIDSAEYYAPANALIGPWLRRHRNQVLLADKVAGDDLSPRHVRAALEQSLRELGCETIDLYQLHWPDAKTPLADTMGALTDLQAEGKIRFIGVSNFRLPELQEACRMAPVATCQPRLNLLHRGALELLPFCSERGLGVLAHSALAKGLLSGRISASHRFATSDERARLPDFSEAQREVHLAKVRRVQRVAQRHGRSLVQLALSWVLAQQGVSVALLGAKNRRQLEEALPAADEALSPSTLAEITQALAP